MLALLLACAGSPDGDQGFRATPVGDLDRDGTADLVVGDRHAEGTAGAVWLYLGSADPVQITAFDATVGDHFGKWVGPAGDVDGDGFLDVVVSAPTNSDAGDVAGAIYVLYGPDLERQQKVIHSDAQKHDYLGWSSGTGVGDLDGDGYDDIAVGSWYDDDFGDASGAAYVFFGGPTGISGERKFTHPNPQPNGLFGTRIERTDDGVLVHGRQDATLIPHSEFR